MEPADSAAEELGPVDGPAGELAATIVRPDADGPTEVD